MWRWFPLVLGLLVSAGWAANDVDQEMRRVEAALARISQEQQSVYQQFQMVQELRRSAQAQMQPLQSYTPPPTPPNYDDVKREEEERTQQIKQYSDELDRLYARYHELEEQKKPLLDELSALAQRKPQEQ
jgi:chromosome segregation ATPase